MSLCTLQRRYPKNCSSSLGKHPQAKHACRVCCPDNLRLAASSGVGLKPGNSTVASPSQSQVQTGTDDEKLQLPPLWKTGKLSAVAALHGCCLASWREHASPPLVSHSSSQRLFLTLHTRCMCSGCNVICGPSAALLRSRHAWDGQSGASIWDAVTYCKMTSRLQRASKKASQHRRITTERMLHCRAGDATHHAYCMPAVCLYLGARGRAHLPIVICVTYQANIRRTGK